jgi:hypothetical protein
MGHGLRPAFVHRADYLGVTVSQPQSNWCNTVEWVALLAAICFIVWIAIR